MTNNFDAESAKKIIYDDNINVTEGNPLKDFFQIVLNLVLILACVYMFVFALSGIIIKNLSSKQQVLIENFISPLVKPCEIVELSDIEKQRLTDIKNRILKVDTKFPDTSNLDINVMRKKQLNALCYPNGHIYITSSLYKELKSEEELTFVIAHEMAHYRYKDHLLNLRRNISNSVILIMIAFANPNNKDIARAVEGSLSITDLTFSRRAEEKADKYAIKIMNILYGNARAGLDVMEKLRIKNSFDIEFLSTHPNFDKRINYIKNFSN